MKSKIRETVIILFVFIFVFMLHLLYFKSTNKETCELTCESISWFQRYIEEKEYFLGASYASSFAFMVFALLRFQENRKNALKAAMGSGLVVLCLWFFCFLFSCCGSPMLIVYLNLVGISCLKLPKFILFLMTILFIAIGYIWLVKKTPKGCCDGEICEEDKK